jgi:predicted nuclease of predicted toxin-antitoxin system
VKILLDECLDWRLLRHLPEHDVLTARQMGWAGVKNGKLLSVAQTEFDAFITVDAQLPSQTNVSTYDIAVIVRSVRSSKVHNILRYLPELRAAILSAPKGSVTRVP